MPTHKYPVKYKNGHKTTKVICNKFC